MNSKYYYGSSIYKVRTRQVADSILCPLRKSSCLSNSLQPLPRNKHFLFGEYKSDTLGMPSVYPSPFLTFLSGTINMMNTWFNGNSCREGEGESQDQDKDQDQGVDQGESQCLHSPSAFFAATYHGDPANAPRLFQLLTSKSWNEAEEWLRSHPRDACITITVNGTNIEHITPSQNYSDTDPYVSRSRTGTSVHRTITILDYARSMNAPDGLIRMMRIASGNGTIGPPRLNTTGSTNDVASTQNGITSSMSRQNDLPRQNFLSGDSGVGRRRIVKARRPLGAQPTFGQPHVFGSAFNFDNVTSSVARASSFDDIQGSSASPFSFAIPQHRSNFQASTYSLTSSSSGSSSSSTSSSDGSRSRSNSSSTDSTNSLGVFDASVGGTFIDAARFESAVRQRQEETRRLCGMPNMSKKSLETENRATKDLVEKSSALNVGAASASTTEETTYSNKKCVVCLDNVAIFAVDPCGHLSLCEECSQHRAFCVVPAITGTSQKSCHYRGNCPECRTKIVKLMRIFA